MFVGFNLPLSNTEIIDNYLDIGNNIYSNSKVKIQAVLNKYLNPDGSLCATAIENDWFESINADVFLSHSHMDEKLAIKLAGYLYSKFKIKCFIDSCVWGYANDLLRIIDDEYCKTIENGDGSYSYCYEQRNNSTSHVHMILNGALAKMINNTECLIFINTPSSINSREAQNKVQTASPWIYSELLMATEFPHRRLQYYRSLKHSNYLYESSELQMEYDVAIDKLEPLLLSDFKDIDNKSQNKCAVEALDQLYLYKGLISYKDN